MRKTILIFAFLLVSLSSFARDGESKLGAESVVFPFSLVPVDPALVGGNSALASDSALGAFSNAALTPFGQRSFGVGLGMSLSKTALSYAAALNYNFASKFGLNLGFLNHSSEEYEIMDVNGVSQGNFTPKDMVLGLGFSYRPFDFFSMGLNAKYLSSNFAPDAKMRSFVLDLSAMYSRNGISAVLGLNSLAPKFADYNLPTYLVAAGQYALKLGEVSVITAGLEVNYFLYGGIRAGINAQYAWNELLLLRLGYSYSNGAPVPSEASCGLGLKFYGVELNLSYRKAQNINSLLFGLAYEF